MLVKCRNGVGDYKAHVVTDYECIGETVKNPSSTTSMKFLSREPEGAKYPPRRRQYVGEVGWKIDDTFMNQVNEKVLQSGNQIQLKIFRKSLEENSTAILTSQGACLGNERGVSGYPPGMPLHESMGKKQKLKAGPSSPLASDTSSDNGSTHQNGATI